MATVPADRGQWLRLAIVVVALPVMLGAGPTIAVKVNDWHLQEVGRLDLSAVWRSYPPKPVNFTHPPAIVIDAGRPVLHLATVAEALRIGRPLQVHLTQTPWLVWEWKAVVLPDGGDIRDPALNDQAGRVMVVFEGMKGILYVWDTTAPVGTELRSDSLDFFERVLIVVRSGRDGVGEWTRQRQNVYADYRRLFDEEPRAIKFVGFESHSNDTRSHTSMLFGPAQFEVGD
jgi:Protein of unknown function (DUF3047)